MACDTLQGGPFSACCAGQKTFPPGIPLLDKIQRRTAHSPQSGSHTLCAKFPWLCPIHPHMSAGWDFLRWTGTTVNKKSNRVKFPNSRLLLVNQRGTTVCPAAPVSINSIAQDGAFVNRPALFLPLQSTRPGAFWVFRLIYCYDLKANLDISAPICVYIYSTAFVVTFLFLIIVVRFTGFGGAFLLV